jgi:hypothetical protein
MKNIAAAPIDLFMKAPSHVADALCRGETEPGSNVDVIPGRREATNYGALLRT